MSMVEQVAGFFQADLAKTEEWFETPNFQLGEVSPNALIEAGREKKLEEIVDYLIGENGK